MRTLLVTLAFSGVALAQQPAGRFYGLWFSKDSGTMPQLLQPLLPKGSGEPPTLVDPKKLLQPKLSPILIAAQRLLELRRMDAVATVCSVPLIEMPIRKDVEFTMRQIVPPADGVAMPRARVPAPPCE